MYSLIALEPFSGKFSFVFCIKKFYSLEYIYCTKMFCKTFKQIDHKKQQIAI